MKGKNTILILASSLILLVITTFLLTSSAPSKPQPSVVPQKKPKILSQKESVTLKFSPDSITLLANDISEGRVIINAPQKKITAVELRLNYDPQKLEITEVEAGEFFEKPDVLLKEIDKRKGKVSFALGSLTPQSGIGNLALIKIKALEETAITQLSFDPATQIAAVGETGSVLKEASPAKFTILP